MGVTDVSYLDEICLGIGAPGDDQPGVVEWAEPLDLEAVGEELEGHEFLVGTFNHKSPVVQEPAAERTFGEVDTCDGLVKDVFVRMYFQLQIISFYL